MTITCQRGCCCEDPIDDSVNQLYKNKDPQNEESFYPVIVSAHVSEFILPQGIFNKSL